MTTKAEELTSKLSYYIENDEIGCGMNLLRELVSAVAEQEKERIRSESELITDAPYSWNRGDPWYLVDVSVLSPKATA